MDAKGWLIEYQRMCRKYRDGESGNCVGCPLEYEYCGFDEELDEERISDIVSAVEKWSAEHPLVTNGEAAVGMMEKMDAPYIRCRKNEVGQVEMILDASWWDAEYKGE